ncbi:RNA polymerase sigma factor SigZ [Lentimicrobium sp. L6]|uniref:RNA polymerase sigma factor SigZ n=1 Tax=Lentimicrobium sp. L6 TaxID=2735916 RepID=UPI00155632F7|nr:RNA polymerase sigma factor SigZ [Lentimicrobium sp. L6]NPD86390.1 RNA polymerase sigma factor SigZ [Lentimicrobium sp. L6]
MTEKIWNKFKEELLGFIISKVNDKDLAHDLLQEVFIKIHLKLSTISDKEKLTSWIYQITRNTIIDHYRKNKQFKEIKEIELKVPEHEVNYNNDLLCCLKPFIEDLPEKYQDALLKTSYGTLSQKEYAKKQELSYSAAKSRIQRARKKLKDSFKKCCATESDKYGNVFQLDKRNCDCD